MLKHYSQWLTTLGVATARPAAFFVFAVYALAWLILDPTSLDWHSVATLATWFMRLVIRRRLDHVERTSSIGRGHESAQPPTADVWGRWR